MKKPKWKIKFYKNYFFTFKPILFKTGLRWKDKFETPRCESPPRFDFQWLGFGIYGWQGDDDWWEQWLWIYKYNDGDIEKAKETWPWYKWETKESSWVDYK
jgi:hypothetical protein